MSNRIFANNLYEQLPEPIQEMMKYDPTLKTIFDLAVIHELTILETLTNMVLFSSYNTRNAMNNYREVMAKSTQPLLYMANNREDGKVKFEIGDVVNYHSLIGGAVTSMRHIITDIERQPNSYGYDVAWITNKSGCIAMDALSK